MQQNEQGLLCKDEVYAIVGAAMEVSNELGCGFLEAVYQEALSLEFRGREIPHVQQPRIQISYKGTLLHKEYVADFVCHDRIIVEIKALKQVTGTEEAQLLNYLKATGYPVGLLLNFGTPKLDWNRYVYTNRSAHTYDPRLDANKR